MKLTLDQALRKGIEAHKSGQVQEADKFYTAILQSEPKHPDANHNMGVLAVNIGKAQGAIPFFKTALEANPSIVQFWLSYIDALVKLERFSDARVIFNQAKDKGIKDEAFDLLEQRMNKLVGNGRDTEFEGGSISAASKSLEPTPEQFQLLINCYNQGQHQQALDQASDMLKQFPRSLTLYNICGAAHAGLENFDAAINSYKIALRINPNFAEAYSNMGIAQQNKGELTEAIMSHRRALEINPGYAEAYYNIGVVLQEQGEPVLAIDSYKQALKIKPNYAEAYNNMGNALKDEGKLGAAIDSYKRALTIMPDYAEAYNNMGIALRDAGELEAAIDSYKHVLEINPNYIEAYNNMGNALKYKDELDAAIDSYKKAIKINPEYFDAYSNMGVALTEKGELSAAIESYKKALKIKPDYPEAYNNIGNALKDKGDLSAALKSYKLALKINPLFADACSNLGILYFELGEYKKAAEQFKVSNSRKSETSYLRCLYLQNEKDSFYEQLDYLISEGEINALIGSLSSRSKIKYRIDSPNPFCNDPLKYVLHADLTEQCNFENTFVKVAKDVLAADSIEYKDQGHLTNGIQTAGNFFTRKDELIDKMKDIIHLEIKKYLDNFKNKEEGFIKNWPSDYNLNGWLVSMKSGGKLSAHMHETGWITGSIYINIPPKSKADSGNLVVCIEEPQYTTEADIGSQKIIDVNTGSLCLFPSSLLHYTIPFESTEERIVLAFDVVPK